jgi:ketosteroid isomerase-like protein
MSIEENRDLVLSVFNAIEQRNNQRFSELLHPDFEIHWPPSLPYGTGKARTWSDIWDSPQPTELERKMDPRVAAANENEVVVLWRQRGVSPLGDRFDGEVLGLYQIREAKLARAQMFYFDTVAVGDFLARPWNTPGGGIAPPDSAR